MTYNDFFNLAKEKGLETIQITEETVIGSETIVLNESLEDYSTINKITAICICRWPLSFSISLKNLIFVA